MPTNDTDTSTQNTNEQKKESSSTLDVIAKSIQILSVVVGVVISVLSYTSALNRESEARIAETNRYLDQKRADEEKRHAEAARPFIKLRQELYLDAVKTAAILSNPTDYTEEELKEARKRFHALYVAELSLVEGFGVETHMRDIAEVTNDAIIEMNDVQFAAFNLAHALRDSLRKSWAFEESLIDNPSK